MSCNQLKSATYEEYLVMMHYGEYNWPQLFTIIYVCFHWLPSHNISQAHCYQ
jgi:hypothetical protein